jgi:hypothetical protein
VSNVKNRTLSFVAIVLCISLTLYLLPLVPPAKATTIYSYTVIFNWKFQANYPGLDPDAQVEHDAEQGMNNESAQQFAARMATTGYWYKIDSISSEATVGNKTGNPYGEPVWLADFAGNTTIKFESDQNFPSTNGTGTSSTAANYKNPEYQLLNIRVLPVQGWEEVIIAIITAIVVAIDAYPLIFLVIVLVGVLAIVYWEVASHGGLSSFFAPGIAGQIIEVIVIVGAIIALIVLLPGFVAKYLPSVKRKAKRASRTRIFLSGDEV